MNKYYSYPEIDLWKNEMWEKKNAPIYKLIEYIQANDTIEDIDYTPSYEYDDINRLDQHPLFRWKTHGIDDPAVVADLKSKGLSYICTGQGGKQGYMEHCWIGICPQKAIDNWTKLPLLIVFDKEDETTPLWTMRAYNRYKKYVEMLEKSMDFMLLILVNQNVDKAKIYFGIMQEVSILYPCDINHMYVDVHKALEKTKLSAIDGFRLVNYKGEERNADDAVESFGSLSVPVLNIAGCWGNGDSLGRAMIVTSDMNEGWFDREWFIHSECGKHMMEGFHFDYDYDYVEDPGLIHRMEEKGLVYKIKYNELGERYIIAAPRQQMEEGKTLPVVLILQEVYGGNEHLAISANSYFSEWLEIAAQGECALVFFVLEDIVSNDRAVPIVRANAEEYHFDLSRVYVTGHSHDGYFTYAFANRNLDFVTAIATMGIETCPVGMNDVQNYTKDHPIKEHDIPTINLMGVCESRFPVNEEEKLTYWAPRWNHVLRNYNCRERSNEEYLAAFDSRNRAEKITAIPGDICTTIWNEGAEHYLIDFVNKEGKKHLRIVRNENMPHTATPFECTLAWNYLRRFKRDPETKKIIELFE